MAATEAEKLRGELRRTWRRVLNLQLTAIKGMEGSPDRQFLEGLRITSDQLRRDFGLIREGRIPRRPESSPLDQIKLLRSG